MKWLSPYKTSKALRYRANTLDQWSLDNTILPFLLVRPTARRTALYTLNAQHLQFFRLMVKQGDQFFNRLGSEAKDVE